MITSIDYFQCRPKLYGGVFGKVDNEIRQITNDIERTFTINAIDCQNRFLKYGERIEPID